VSRFIQRGCAENERKEPAGLRRDRICLASLAFLLSASSFAASSSQDYSVRQHSSSAGGGRSVSSLYVIESSFGLAGGVIRSGSGEIVVWADRLGMLTHLNTAPVPRNLSFERHPGSGIRIAVSKIVQSAYDPDGDTLDLTAFDSITIRGGVVQRNANWLIYEPMAGNSEADSFTFSIADGGGEVATGTVQIAVWQGSGAPTENVSRVVVNDDDVIVKFVGIPGFEYQIESTASLTNPQWQPLARVVAGTNGRFEIREIRRPEGVQFYRALSIPRSND
jgi:hypothetical protein